VARDTIEPMPVIVGAPRSGTTMLRFMLDAHPEVAVPPETGFLWLASDPQRLAAMTAAEFADAVVTFPTGCPNWPDHGIDEADFRAAIATIRPFSPAAGFRCFYELYAASRGKPRYGDKTPFHSFFMEHIERVLPEVHFIHIVRDGRDACLSWRKTWFQPTEEIGELAFEWMKYVLAARRQGRRAGAYLEIRYEELVRNPEPVLRTMCEFLGLEFDAAMLRSYEGVADRLREFKPRAWADGSRHVSIEERLANQRLTQLPPDESRIEAWRNEMTEAEWREFAAVAGGTLTRLGYPLE
jgi:LPS sulfotransferase NodH